VYSNDKLKQYGVMTMEFPVTLNVPVGSTVGSEPGLPLVESEIRGKGFSEQLEKNVNLLGEGLSEEGAGAENMTKEEFVHLPPLGEEVIPESVINVDLLDVVFFEKAGFERTPEVLPIGGNKLPSANELNAEFKINEKKGPVLSALSKKQESGFKIKETTNPLLAENLPLKEKGGDRVFTNMPLDLAVNKPAYENAAKAIMNVDLMGELTQKLSGKPASLSSDLLPNNLTHNIASPTPPSALQQVSGERGILQLDTPVASPRWAQDFSQRIQWVANQSMSGAQIRLNPQNMGPVEVRLQMQNDQVSLSFTAQHGATREVIEAALPRLRELFSEQNINMTDVDISEHSFAEQRERQRAGGELSVFNEDEKNSDLLDAAESEQRIHYTGLFNGFA